MNTRSTTLTLLQGLALCVYCAIFYVLVVYPQALSLWRLILFGLGLIVGTGVLWLDEKYGYQYYRNEEVVPEQMEQPPQLITRSLLFVGSLIPLGFFLISSTGSSLGVGMFLGLCVGLSFEMAWYLQSPAAFDQRFLTQLRRQLEPQERKMLVSGFVAATVIFSLLLFI